MPDQFGWWFFSPKLENWDLAKPIRVEGYIGENDKEWKFRYSDGIRDIINPSVGWWFGPIKIEQPHLKHIDIIKYKKVQYESSTKIN